MECSRRVNKTEENAGLRERARGREGGEGGREEEAANEQKKKKTKIRKTGHLVYLAHFA